MVVFVGRTSYRNKYYTDVQRLTVCVKLCLVAVVDVCVDLRMDILL